MLSEPPGADPHARWCGRRRGKPGAYPILRRARAQQCARAYPTAPGVRGHAIGVLASAGIVETELRAAAPGFVEDQHYQPRVAWCSDAAARQTRDETFAAPRRRTRQVIDRLALARSRTTRMNVAFASVYASRSCSKREANRRLSAAYSAATSGCDRR
jgi:hypothetical protein